jgi:hypothetical protein
MAIEESTTRRKDLQLLSSRLSYIELNDDKNSEYSDLKNLNELGHIEEAFERSKKRLENIDLQDKNGGKMLLCLVNENYKWESLFISDKTKNKSIPSANPSQQKKKEFIFPLALINEKEENIEQFTNFKNHDLFSTG